jgi:TRAP-type C4-dicarboxylate transport system permease small subunit
MRSAADTWLGRLDRWALYLATIGGLCLLGILLTVTAGVVMRYAFGAPLLGINEIVQLAAVALVMAGLPYCTAQEDHVAVDVFEGAIGRWGRFVGDLLSRILAGIVLAILCRRAVLKALDAWEWGDATNMLRIPIWPFYAVLASGAGLCVLVFGLQLLHLLMRGPK